MITLDDGSHAEGRPFASPERSAEDAAVMVRMLTRLRRHVASLPAGAAPRVDRFTDPDGSQHTIVLPAVRSAHERGDRFAVGFFGQARHDVDHRPIVRLESALIDAMPGTPGLVAYYNTFQPPVGWGNLVLFADASAKDAWGRDARHGAAVERSPRHYHSIRLHNAIARGGLAGDGALELVRTRYLDFRDAPAWRAIRHYR